MLGLLTKLLLPAVILYMAQKWFRESLMIRGSENQKRPRRDEADIIEICTKCGEVLKDQHRC